MIKRSLAAAVAATTLLSGNAFAAEDFEVGVSGFIHAAVSASDVSDEGNEKDLFNVHNDNLIEFSGASVLDNGLKVVAVASFSMTQGNDLFVTENQNNFFKEELYIGLGGSFGQVDIGRRANAASLLHTYIPSAGVGGFGVDNARMSAFTAGNNNTTTAVSLGDNSRTTRLANRIQYFTPRIEGLQLAASYTPDTNPNDSNANVATPGRYQSSLFYKNEYSLAAHYARNFDGLDLAGSVGYTSADANEATNPLTTNDRDFEAMQAGLSLGFDGFTVAAAYGEVESGLFTSGKDRRYGGGVKYETGPWGFGLSYLQRRATDGTSLFLANGQEVRSSHFWEVGTSYALGPGVSTGAGVYYNDNENRTDVANPAAEDSVTGVVNLSVNF